MRLKLNRTLRTALIAAISTVGFTLTQAQAADETVTILTLPGSVAQLKPTPSGWKQSIGAQTSINGADVANDLKVSSTLAADGWHWGMANAQDANGGDFQVNTETQSFQFKGRQAYGGEFVAGTVDIATLCAESENNAVSALTFNFAKGTPSQGDLTFSAWYWDGISSTATALVSATTNLSSEVTPYTWTADEGKALGEGKILIVFSESSGAQDNTINNFSATATLTYVAPAVASVWQGTDAQHAWYGETSWNPAFTDEGNVEFNGTGYGTVTVDEFVAAGNVSINAGSYTFEMDETALMANTLTVNGTGANLMVKGSGSLVANRIVLGAGNTITASDGMVIDLIEVQAIGEGAAILIDSTATGEILGDSANVLEYVSGAGDIHVATDALFKGSSSQGSPATTHSTGTLFVDEGVTLSIGTKNTGGYAHTYVDMTSFEKIQLDGSNLYIHNDEFTLNNLTVTAKGGKVTIHDTTGQDNNTLTLAGTTQLDGNLTFVGTWKQKFTIDALAGEGALILNGVDHDKQIVNIGGGSVGKLQIGKSNVEANITGDLTVGGLTGTEGTVNVSAGKKLTFNVAEDTAYTYSGTLNVGGQIVKTGEGSQTIGGTALNHTILAQGGTLVLNGNYAIDNIAESTIVNTTVDYAGNESDNGFHKAFGTINVYSGDGTLNLDAAHFMYGTTDVTEDVKTGNGKYTLSESIDKSTVYVTKGSLDIANYKTDALTGVVLSDGTTVNMDAAVTVGVKLAENATATLTAEEATTISGITGSGTKLVVNGDSTVTLASANAITAAVEIAGTATLKLGSEGSLGNTSGVTVRTGATLDINGAKDPATCISVTLDGGTLANTGGAVSHGTKQLVTNLTVTKDSSVNAANNEFGLIAGGYNPTTLALDANLEKLGSHDFHLTNTTVTGDGAIKVTEGAVWFSKADAAQVGSYAADFIMNGGVVNGRLALGSDITVTTTAEGSTFSASVANGGFTITFAGDKDLTMSGVISGNGGITKDGEGTLTLNGAQTYTGTTEVKAGKLVVNGTIASQNVTLGENASIENNGSGPITLSDVDVQLAQVENFGAGELKLQNASGTVSVMDLSIGEGSTVSFYDKADTPDEGTITVMDTLTAGGGTLKANLTLVGDSTLDLSLMAGGMQALTLGSKLTMDTTTGLINLDDATIDALSLLGMGQSLTLVQALDETTLAYGADDYTGTWYGQMFNRTDALVGDFQVFASAEGFGLTKVSNTPEPTTGTLSLLALMALAARRRRK